MSDKTTTPNHKTVDDLRAKLFEAIDGVRSGAITIDQARQISDLGQVIVNSAKVEVEHARIVEGARSRFLPAPAAAEDEDEGDGDAPEASWPPGINGVRRHRLGR